MISQISGWEFNDKICVVSFLNTGSPLTGHGAIVVEGVINETLFIGQYEVRSKIVVDETISDVVQRTMGNAQGYIAEIRVIENDQYTRDYSKYSHKSWYASPENVQLMIQSIKNEQRILQQAVANGEELPYKYQTAGSNRSWYLGGNGGESCVTWAERQLAVAQIGNGLIIGDWVKAVPELHTCTVL